MFKQKILLKSFEKNKKIIYLYVNNNHILKTKDIKELSLAVGWSNRNWNKVKKAIKNSSFIITLWYRFNIRKQLVGFLRVVSDNTFNAIIWDVMIHPRFQKKKLGKFLIDYTVKELKKKGIQNIALFSYQKAINFYSRLSFKFSRSRKEALIKKPRKF
uniref:N-acetyltransferase domain-containing protein n=1 Tax=Glaucocystis incrassata TaxID=1789788 RepID=A0A3G1IVD9_9EUKA|nr:hypothetical protein ycf52 [Glaucocystis incrassata]ASQ40002.1 hypothetical protein ycf52 [Glaucocystis incrassata]